MAVLCGTQPSPRTYSHHSAACSSQDPLIASVHRLKVPYPRTGMHASRHGCKRGHFVVQVSERMCRVLLATNPCGQFHTSYMLHITFWCVQAALPPTVVLSVVQQGAALGGLSLASFMADCQAWQPCTVQHTNLIMYWNMLAAVTVVAEGIYTRTQMKPTAPGRPSILPIVASTLGLVAVGPQSTRFQHQLPFAKKETYQHAHYVHRLWGW